MQTRKDRTAPSLKKVAAEKPPVDSSPNTAEVYRKRMDELATAARAKAPASVTEGEWEYAHFPHGWPQQWQPGYEPPFWPPPYGRESKNEQSVKPAVASEAESAHLPQTFIALGNLMKAGIGILNAALVKGQEILGGSVPSPYHQPSFEHRPYFPECHTTSHPWPYGHEHGGPCRRDCCGNVHDCYTGW
jgi:hypothetical protein